MPTKEELTEAANATPVASPYYVTVLYGDYGSRKTSIACDLSNERGLLLCSDDSWKVLLNDRHREVHSRTKIVTLAGLSQLDYIDFDGYDTIIWDTMSQSVDRFLDLLYDEADWGKGSNGVPRFRDSVVTKNPELKDLQTLAPVDYRVTRDKLRPVFNRLFEQTKAHIVFTSQMTEPVPGLSQNQQKRPSIPQSTFKVVATRADIIANTRLSGIKSIVDSTQNLTQLGKSRIEGIQGPMDQNAFIQKYKEIVFK